MHIYWLSKLYISNKSDWYLSLLFIAVCCYIPGTKDDATTSTEVVQCIDKFSQGFSRTGKEATLSVRDLSFKRRANLGVSSKCNIILFSRYWRSLLGSYHDPGIFTYLIYIRILYFIN